MDTVKKITTLFCDKVGASSPGSIYSGLYAVEKMFEECNEALSEAGMGECCYSFQAEAISQMTEDMQILKTYVQYAHTYVWQTLDHPLWADFNAHATQSLSEIVLDDISTDNTFQMEEHVEVTRQGYGGPHKKVKSELKFSDFLGLVEITPEDGYPVLENVECVGEFASLFRADYDRMKPEGTDINTFLEGYLVSGEYDHTVYDPVKDFISGLLDITIIKPIIECFTGEDLITGATLSDLERALKLGGAIVDLFTLGQAMVLTKGAGLGAKAIGKTVILELASNAAVYSVGYGCDALGMPVVASWGLSILTGCTVSAVGGKYLFKDSSGNVIKECTSLEAEQILKRGAELDGNAKTYVDWMLPKDAEVFLQYKATGSLDGLSEADINSIRKLEELIELKQVEYQDIFNVRNRDEVLARNSKVHRVEDVDGGGTPTYSSREWYDYLNETYGKGNVEWSSGEVNGVKAQNIEIIDAKTANENWAKMGYDEPPYKPDTEVYVFKVAEEAEFVRVYSYKSDGTSNKLGGWLMRKQDIEGLSASEIADKYALPKIPTHICDVKVPEGFSLEMGEANKVKGWGNGGGTQFDTMGKFIDEDAFVNERLIGE